jgi:hypothetical protein
MSVGAQLRAAREARDLSIEDLARTIRVKPLILAAIERDEIDAVPPRPFGRGFVSAYAREVGLDPDELARRYFAQFAAPALPPPVVEPAPRRLGLPAALLGAVAVIAVVGLIAALRPDGPAPSVAPDVGAVRGTSGRVATALPEVTPASRPTDPADAIPSPAVRAPAPPPVTTAPDPAPATTAPLTIVVRATRRSWVAARADGDRVLFQNLRAGESRTLTAAKMITLRVGDAGALSWEINGRDAGRIGRSGQVRDVRITPATAERFR